jgi:hypothetical protein
MRLTAGAAGSGTSHAVTPSSQANYSSAVEKPIWSFSCDSASHKWTFTIDDVQVMDASGHTWGGMQGPWSVGIFSQKSAGAVPFNARAHLHQNTTNGLFTGTVSGSSADAGQWCQSGASVTVDAFSGSQEPLLLDGTLG